MDERKRKEYEPLRSMGGEGYQHLSGLTIKKHLILCVSSFTWMNFTGNILFLMLN